MSGRSMLVWCGVLGVLVGCTDGKPGGEGDPGVEGDTGGLSGDDGGSDDTDDTDDTDVPDDSGDTDPPDDTAEPPPDPISATIRGTVEVQPYRLVDGVREAVDPADLVGLDFPYGAIFVAAYDDTDGDGHESYHGTDVVSTPLYGPNTFELPVVLDAAGEVYVYAALDENANTIIESIDPIGLWPDEVDLVDGAVIEDVVIRIVVSWDAITGGGSGSGGSGSGSGSSGGSGSGSSGGSGGESGSGSGTGGSGSGSGSSGGSGSGSSGSGGTEGCDVVIEGPITLHTTYEGSGLVMLQNPDGTGPVDWTWFDVESGASGSDYFLSTCPDQGQMRLTAAIDSNDNGLIDPADTSGVYVSTPGVDGNPITIGTADLTNMEIELPVYTSSGSGGEEEVVSGGISLVPFVRLSGQVCHEDGTYDTMDVGSTVLVTALKYRPNTSVLTSAFASDAFDTHTFAWSELTGQACVDYLLYVPANTDLYLWAYGDPDLDGTVNEAGEPVGNGGTTSNGLVQVGTEDVVQDFLLGTL